MKPDIGILLGSIWMVAASALTAASAPELENGAAGLPEDQWAQIRDQIDGKSAVVQGDKLLPSPDFKGQDYMESGFSVAVDGDTMVVGARWEDYGIFSRAGAVYVFLRSGGVWSQQQRLVIPSPEADDEFGTSVAVSGDTVVVGAPGDDDVGTSNRGSAYVFTRSGGVWSQQQILLSADAENGDAIGCSVAVDGNTAVVGARGEDGAGLSGSGAAYVFVRTGGLWSEQQKLAAGDAAEGYQFGTSVAVEGDSVVVGAVNGDSMLVKDCGAAYVFVRTGSVWIEEQQLIADDGVPDDRFGASVAISGLTVVAGAPGVDEPGWTDRGAAYVFVRSTHIWTQETKLLGLAYPGAENGLSVGVSGDIAVIGGPYGTAPWAPAYAGFLCVFSRSGTTWSQEAVLEAGDADVNDHIGHAAAISGETVVAGAPGDDRDGGVNAGSAYVFTRSGTVWSEEQKVVPQDAALGDAFGWSLAVDGGTALVGAPLDDHGGKTNAGAAYVFTRSGFDWTLQQKLIHPFPVASDYFGASVALVGDTAVVGAPYDEYSGLTDPGSATVFVRSGGVWSLQQTVEASDKQSDDHFGTSVAIHGDTVVVGAPDKADATGAPEFGAAYAFVRSGVVWTEEQKLVSGDAAMGDKLGQAVAVWGDSALVGVPFDDDDGDSSGSAYIFVRSGGVWTQEDKLNADDGGGGDCFGYSVALDEETALIGAYHDGDNGADSGSAYVFVGPANVWRQEQKLVPGDGAASDFFGISVSLIGDTALIGAHGDDEPVGADVGSAYTFTRSGSVWSQEQKLTADDSALTDNFGFAVALSTDSALAGARYDDHGWVDDAGSVYVFEAPRADLEITKTDGQDIAVPGQPVIYTITAGNPIGPQGVIGATVSDVFPPELQGCTWTCVGLEGAVCAPGPQPGNIDDTVSLPVGATATYTVSCVVAPGATGSVTNTATVTAPAGTTETDPSDNAATDIDVLAPQADLAITKTDGQTSAVPGTGVPYTVVVTNTAGPSHVVGATVSDVFPAELTDCSWTCIGAGGGTCNPGPVVGDINDSVGLPVGASVTYTASCVVAPGATGSVSNTAVVTTPAGTTETDPSDNVATDTDVLTPEADLAITKTDGQTFAVIGEDITYAIVATNSSGPSDASGVTVADAFPPDLTDCAWTCVGAGGGTCSAGPVSGNINDTIDLPSGASATYTATCTLGSSASGTVVNTATIAPPMGVTDPSPGNNTAEDSDVVVERDFGDAPDPSYPTLLAGGGAYHLIVPGYCLGATVDGELDGQPTAGADGDDNDGTDDEELPSQLLVFDAGSVGSVQVTVTGAGFGNAWIDFNQDGDWGDPGEQVMADVPLIAGAQSVPVSTPADAALGTTFMRLRFSSQPGLGPDGQAPDGEVEDYTVDVRGTMDLAITKDNGVTWLAEGFSTTYSITVSNAGPSNVIGAEVSDAFPAELSSCAWTCDTTGGGTCTAAGANDIVDSVDLPVGTSVEYTATCTVVASSGLCVNTATVTPPPGLTDPDPSNNSATDTDRIEVGAIFWDGFEDGTTLAWSSTEPPPLLKEEFHESPGDRFVATMKLDLESIPSDQGGILLLVVGFDEGDLPIFSVDLRSTPTLAVRARVYSDGGSRRETAWVEMPYPDDLIRLEWSRSIPDLADGRLELSVEGLPPEFLEGLADGHRSLTTLGWATAGEEP